MFFTKPLRIILPALLVLPLAGCLNFGGQQQELPPDGGVYRSIDSGATWQQKTLVSTVSGRPGNFGNANFSAWALDPSDSNTLYYSGAGAGLFYTYDSANSWHKAEALGNITALDIAVDPNDKCTIFITSGNRVLRTRDCSRTWQEVYVDNVPQQLVKTAVVDHFNSDVVYIGLNRGDIIKSQDGGDTWKPVNRFNAPVEDLLIDPADSRVLYAVITNQGIRQSRDGGINWENISDPLREHNIGLAVRSILLGKENPDLEFIAAAQGIIRSQDGGESWEKLEIITLGSNNAIRGLAVNPQNPEQIYYVTNTTFYRSNDGGENWQTIALPTTRQGRGLLVNPKNPNVMFLAPFRPS